MGVISIMPNGGKVYATPNPSDHERAKRQNVEGWTARSARGNRDFLMSVDGDRLPPGGHAVTLTVRDMPPTHDDWASMRDTWAKRMARAAPSGFRLHWVTEWQERGHPHTHAALWCDLTPAQVLGHWLDVAAPYRPLMAGQDSRPIFQKVGWFEYLAKHASRGVNHYQRNPGKVPKGWKKTGRVWGYRGDWPTVPAGQIYTSYAVSMQYRRLLLRYLRAQAIRRGDTRRAVWLRSVLRREEKHSRVYGVSDWIPQADQLRLLDCVLTDRGDSRQDAQP